MNQLDEFAKTLIDIADRLQQHPVSGHWVTAFVGGDAIGTDQAAFVCGCSAQTIRRRAAEAADNDHPIGIWFAQSVWLISLSLLLDWIEKHEGRHERLVAATRADNYAKLNVPLQTAPTFERAATV